MRLAFVDTEFAWPPPGGAQVQLVEDMTQLQAMGHEVRLFAPTARNVWKFAHIDADALPVPVQQFAFAEKPYPPEQLVPQIAGAVEAFQADVVVLAFGFYSKAYLAEALAKYPLISRYYTYEALCPRDFLLYKYGGACPNDYLRTPNRCRRCYLGFRGQGIAPDTASPFVTEFLRVGGFGKKFHSFWLDHLSKLDALVVYNDILKERLQPYNSNVFVVPGGVHVEEFRPSPPPERGPGNKKTIFMSGRLGDPMKGLKVLRAACDALWTKRQDFELLLTGAPAHEPAPYARFAGWRPREELPALYKEADICIVPSVWDEPFGLVAVEAMASARPVIASRVGGLQHIIVEGETGFLFERRNSEELARHIETLLDAPNLRRRMGEAGRKRAEDEYDWPVVVRKHWPKILESVLP